MHKSYKQIIIIAEKAGKRKQMATVIIKDNNKRIIPNK